LVVAAVGCGGSQIGGGDAGMPDGEAERLVSEGNSDLVENDAVSDVAEKVDATGLMAEDGETVVDGGGIDGDDPGCGPEGRACVPGPSDSCEICEPRVGVNKLCYCAPADTELGGQWMCFASGTC